MTRAWSFSSKVEKKGNARHHDTDDRLSAYSHYRYFPGESSNWIAGCGLDSGSCTIVDYCRCMVCMEESLTGFRKDEIIDIITNDFGKTI